MSYVEYVLDYPNADDLIQSFPVYLVTEDMAARLLGAGLSGFEIDEVEVRPSPEYTAAYGRAPHAKYKWLRLDGAESADCWLDETYLLCVSQRMMEVLEAGRLSGCDIVELA